MIKLFVFDIEGCLNPRKGEPFSVKIIRDIQDYNHKEEAIPVVFCTGRPQPYVEAVIQMFDAFSDSDFPSVIENGCFLYFPVSDSMVPHPLVAERREEFRKIKAFFEEEKVGRIEPGKEVCISLNCFSESESIEELEKRVREKLPSDLSELVFITHSNSAVDLIPAGIDKGTGLEFLSKKTGIKLEEMVGIGDSRGDLPFLKKVGYLACPPDASDRVIGLVRERGGCVGNPAMIINYYSTKKF